MGQFLAPVGQQIPQLLRDLKTRITRVEHKVEKLAAKPTDTGGITVTFSATEPLEPDQGDVWYQTSGSNITATWQYDGTDWQPYTVTADDVAAGSITSAAFATGAVDNAALAPAAVESANLATDAVGNDALAPQAVTTDNVAPGTSIPGAVNGTTITGAQFVSTGTNQNVLAYNGTPAAGNMLASVSPVAGTDSKSNPYQAGLAVYGPNKSYIALESSTSVTEPNIKLQPQSVTNLHFAPQIDATAVNAGNASTEHTNLWIQAGIETGAVNSPFIQLQGSSKDGSAEGAVWVGFQNEGTTYSDIVYLSTTQMTTAAAVNANNPQITDGSIQTEWWHPFNPLTTGYAVPSDGYAEYKLYPDNTVGIRGYIQCAPSSGPGANWVTINQTALPAEYRPNLKRYGGNIGGDVLSAVGGSNNAGPGINLSTFGYINITGFASGYSGTMHIWFNERFPLD